MKGSSMVLFVLSILLIVSIFCENKNPVDTENYNAMAATDSSGKCTFQSNFFGKTIEVTVSNQQGTYLEGMEIYHDQVDSVLFIVVNDNSGYYAPSILITNPYQILLDF